tara:strand:+ start:251 stop:442 length:192 start_codon:yes stop_codon:yes gene_type:complete
MDTVTLGLILFFGGGILANMAKPDKRYKNKHYKNRPRILFYLGLPCAILGMFILIGEGLKGTI